MFLFWVIERHQSFNWKGHTCQECSYLISRFGGKCPSGNKPPSGSFSKNRPAFFWNSNLFCHSTICLISSQAEIHRHRAQFILDVTCYFDDMCSLHIVIWKLKSEFHYCNIFNNIQYMGILSITKWSAVRTNYLNLGNFCLTGLTLKTWLTIAAKTGKWAMFFFWIRLFQVSYSLFTTYVYQFSGTAYTTYKYYLTACA